MKYYIILAKRFFVCAVRTNYTHHISKLYIPCKIKRKYTAYALHNAYIYIVKSLYACSKCIFLYTNYTGI